MNNFFVETESKIFCVLVIAFLYVFQTYNCQSRDKENKLLYLFSFIEILFSIIGNTVENAILRDFCFIVCGVSCFFALGCCCEYAFRIAGYKATILQKVLCVFVGAIVGILSFYSLKIGFDAINFLLIFIIIAMFAIEQNNKIKVDNLTKLYNRYGMDVELKEQLRQYEREHSDSFYIIACDLDNFKHINDTWGHPEGDRALVLIAGALARVGKMFNSGVFRIGGDEFVIITDTSEEGLASDVTNAIKTELDNIDFRDDFDIEMSIGVALYDGVTPIDELLNNADKKLYEAKKKGKSVPLG